MALSIGIRNFQSISKAKLRFEPGLTVITGSTNSGKTAIFRAIASVLDNPKTGKSRIKKGHKEAVVLLQFEDNTVAWIRRGDTVQYDVDGVRHTKCGRVKADELVPRLPLRRDPETGKLVNFHLETDVLFPFENSPESMFRTFERVFSIEDSSTIIAKMREDEAETKRRVEANAKEITSCIAKIVTIDAVVSDDDDDACVGVRSIDEKKLKDLQTNMDHQAIALRDHEKCLAEAEIAELRIGAARRALNQTRKQANPGGSLGPAMDMVGVLSASAEVERLERSIASIISIPRRSFDTSIFNEFKGLVDLLKDLEGITSSLESLDSSIRIFGGEKVKLEEELKGFVACPLCGQSLECDT